MAFPTEKEPAFGSEPEHVYDGFNFDSTNVSTQFAAVEAAVCFYLENQEKKTGWIQRVGASMTLDEIAKELGVSKSTVSRALSGKGRIGEETRKKIEDFVKRSQTAGMGEKKERPITHNIGVVLPADVYYGGGAYFQNCLLGICEAASSRAVSEGVSGMAEKEV